jgi:hypothetical protein
MVGLGTRSIIERVEIGNSQPKAARASALPDSALRRGMRSGIVVVRSVARRSGSSVIVGAVTIGSMQCNSQDHSSWDKKRLVGVGAVGNAPIPRWSLFVT